MNLNIKASKLTKDILEDENRIVINSGGTSSGKTYNLLIALIIKGLQEQNKLFSIVSESLPHLKRGAMKDFITILKDFGMYSGKMHNKSDHKFKIGSCVFEFFGADSDDKLRGARRDYLFINECNNVKESAFDQLEVRTKEQVFLDFNPVQYFWAHDLEGLESVSFTRTTYLDNPFLDDNIIKSIERRKITNPDWWQVYGLGQVGTLEGLIYTNWSIGSFDDSLPYVFGLDFGFNPDPSCLAKVAINKKTSELFIHESFYKADLTGEQMHNEVKANIKEDDLIICDTNEPRTSNDLRQKGINIIKAKKGKDSVRNGIIKIQDYKITVTAESVNVIRELRNYTWNDKKAGVPMHEFSHSLDAIRYAFGNLSRSTMFIG